MTITLRPEQEQRITEALRSGAYQSPDDVIGHALELLHEQNEWLAAHSAEIAAKIEAGYSAAQRGELIDGEQVRAQIDEEKQAWMAEQRRT